MTTPKTCARTQTARKWLMGASLMALSIGFGTAAEAQDAAAGATQVEEIVVTSQRREERLQDTPISVAAFSSRNLEERGVTNLKSVTYYIPNIEFTVTNRPTAGGSAYAAWIRGVGTGDYAYPTDPGVGLYVDGVYLARTLGGLLSVSDIQRVEVLRGPQGTLYGRNTIGGAINVITTDARLNGGPTGSVLARVGSYGRADLTGDINGPLVEDKVGGKLSFGLFNSSGWGHRLYTGERTNDERRMVLRGALLFQLAPDLTLDVKADYSRQRNKGALGQLVGSYSTPALIARFNSIAAPVQNVEYKLPAGSVYSAPFVVSDYNTYSASPLRDDYDIGGGSATFAYTPSKAFNFKSITAWRKLKTHIQVDGDNSPYRISATDETIRDQQISQEFQLNGQILNDRVRYLVGAYIFRELGKGDKYSLSSNGVYEITRLASDARDNITLQKYDARSYALFTQEDITLVDGLDLTLGARINKDKKEFQVGVYLPQLNNAVSVPYQVREASWDSFTPKVGLNWKPNDDVMLYGSYSAGFKSGGFGNPTAVLLAPAYDPEKLKTFEVGAKTQWFDRRLTANFAAFRSTWEEIQFNVIVPGPTGGVVNVTSNGGDARLYGFEAELVATPAEGLTFNLGLGYTHHKFIRLAAGAVTAGVTLATELPHVPKWTATPGVQYKFATGLGDFTLRADASYRSRQVLAIGDPTSTMKAYTLVNARASFTPASMPRLELALEATNITDKRYLVYSQNATIFGVQINVPGDPRLLAATARYRF